MYIIFIPLFEYFYSKKSFKNSLKISFFIISIGCFLIFFKNIEDINFNYGDFLTILCAFFFALNIFIFSHINFHSVNIKNITVIQLLTVGVIGYVSTCFISGIFIPIYILNFPLLYLIIVCTLINFLLQNISQKYVSSYIVGILLSLESVFGTVFSIIFLKEKLTLNFLIGGILILIGILFAQKGEKNDINSTG